MKKFILSITVIAVFAFTSCSSDDDGKSCQELVTDISASLEVYFENDTEANCNAYKASLQAYVNNNCPGSEEYAAIIAGLDCTEQ